MTAFIHSELPWSYLPSNGYDWFLPRTDPEQAALCLDCTLPDAGCEKDERCPFYRKHHKQQQMAKASYRARQGWERAVDEAAARIWAEREAECAT